LDTACQARRCRVLIANMNAANSGRPARMTSDRRASTANMNAAMNIRLSSSRIRLMMPLDRTSDTALT